MPNTHLFDLPVDVIERFLSYSPDYDCLWSFIATGKTLYHLFHSRHDYYMNAIGENQFGQALYYARYLCRCATIDWVDKKDEGVGYVDTRVNLPTSSLSPVDTHWTEQPRILFSEGRLLNEIARIMNAWEAHYSNLYKDRTSGPSKLTTQESYRFTRALCRMWAFINHWHYDQTPRPDPPFRYEFNLKTYGETILEADEVRELRDVWLFLSEVVGWMSASSGFVDIKPRRSVVFNQTPKGLLQCFTMQDIQWPYRRFLTRAESASTVLTNLCRAHNISDDIHTQSTSILAQLRCDSTQECAQCHTAKAGLWGQSNLYWLRGYLPPQHLAESLSLERSTTMDVRDYLHRPDTYAQFLREMHGISERGDTEGSQVLKEFVCIDCVKGLVMANIRGWLSTRFKGNKQETGVASNQCNSKGAANEGKMDRSCADKSISTRKSTIMKAGKPQSRRAFHNLSSPRRKTVALPTISSSGSDRMSFCPEDWPFTVEYHP